MNVAVFIIIVASSLGDDLHDVDIIIGSDLDSSAHLSSTTLLCGRRHMVSRNMQGRTIGTMVRRSLIVHNVADVRFSFTATLRLRDAIGAQTLPFMSTTIVI